MSVDSHFWFFALASVMLVGLAKGGLTGLGALGMPLMALAVPPVAAAAILLPILIVQDAASIWAFRKDWDGRILAITVPAATIGIGLGYIYAANVSPAAVMGVVGAIALLFGAYRLAVERRAVPIAPRRAGLFGGVAAGFASGFTSQIAHAGGPPLQMWLLPQRLERDIFIGTNAIFFGVVNWIKVPAYIALGGFTTDHLTVSAMLMPVALLSTFAGVRLARRMDAAIFYRIVYVLMILIGIKLLWEALA